MIDRSRNSYSAKLLIVIAAGVVGVLGFSEFLSSGQRPSASASGPSASHTNAPGETNCTECHASFPVNSGTGSVTILDLPRNYRPGQHIPVRVRVSQADGVIYGFQMTAIDSFGRAAGTYTLPGGSPQRLQVVPGIVDGIQRSYIEHTIDGLFLPMTFGFYEWTFMWNAPSTDVGKVSFYAAGNAANSDGTTSGDYIYTTSKDLLTSGTVPRLDFDGDGKTDVGIFRPNAAAEWWILRSSNNSVFAAQFGASTDRVAPADFTGDGKADMAFFRPSTGQWFVLRSEDLSFYGFPFGSTGDITTPADFDGDGKADPAVFRPSSASWFILRSSDGGVTSASFGVSTDQPVAADYDADGKADLAVWRSNPGQWWIQRSTAGLFAANFGQPGDKTVQGDWTGDGKADCAFFRPSSGTWFILRSEDQSFFGFPFGNSTDTPVPGDYDGDGKFDAGVFRQPAAQLFVNKSSGGVLSLAFGQAGDQPVPGAYVR
jgi:hypothetical protein